MNKPENRLRSFADLGAALQLGAGDGYGASIPENSTNLIKRPFYKDNSQDVPSLELTELLGTNQEASVARVRKRVQRSAEVRGFGATLQGQAARRRYKGELADHIRAAKVPRPIQKACLRIHRGADDWADRLLLGGLVSAYHFEGEQTFNESASRLGSALGLEGNLGVKMGAFGIQMLTKLDIFSTGKDGVLILTPTEEYDALLEAVLIEAASVNPLMFPMIEQPLPWTQVGQGVVPDGHWMRPKLVNRSRRVENVLRNAIGADQALGVLSAISSAQAVCLEINKYVLRLLEKSPAPPVPNPLGPEASWWERQAWYQAKDRVRAWHLDLRTARAYEARRFCLPHDADFRGRVYPTPTSIIIVKIIFGR